MKSGNSNIYIYIHTHMYAYCISLHMYTHKESKPAILATVPATTLTASAQRVKVALRFLVDILVLLVGAVLEHLLNPGPWTLKLCRNFP